MMRPVVVTLFMFCLVACGQAPEAPSGQVGGDSPPQAVAVPGAYPRNAFYQCADVPVSLEFPGDGTVKLMFEDRMITLQSVPAASGAKYADAAGNEFWSKDGATLVIAGQAPRECTPI